MELTNEFSVAAPIDVAWATLLDVERIAPCMPGAALTSFDGENFTGTVKVKLGPVSLTYAGKGRFVAKDDAAHRIVIEASGKDNRGAATAAATVTGTLHAEGETTRVHVVTDLRITGAPAQFGRGMVADVAGRLVGQFAGCLAATIAAAADGPAAEPSAARATAESAAEPDSSGASDLATAAAIVTTAAAADPAAASTIAGSTAAPRTIAAKGVEPLDLLTAGGSAAAARRTIGYVLSFLAGAAVGGLVVWLLT